MNIRIYPGMNCHGLEFFLLNGDFKIIQNGTIKSFNEIPYQVSQLLEEHIQAHTEIENALIEMHPESRIKRIEQFAKCRFGGLDYEADIKDNVLQDGEYWPCPLHGSCKHEGTLCKLPIVNGQRLNMNDVKLIQLSATNKTNEVIAEEMELALGTFHQLKKYLHEKVAVQTKQELTRIGVFFSLIWS